MASNTVHVDPSNEGQLRAWDGDEGSYWAANADRYDRAVQVHHHRLLAAAGIGTTTACSTSAAGPVSSAATPRGSRRAGRRSALTSHRRCSRSRGLAPLKSG